MTAVQSPVLWALAAGIAAAGCAERGGETPDSTRAVADASVGTGAAKLRTAAEEVVNFLAGDADFATLELADTVELYVAPEGGGARARIPRQRLRQRDAWRVDGGSMVYSFVPPAPLTKMTTSVGAHMNCREYPLASRVPTLASRPHVGVRLEPAEMRSCLETWNATFVFDTGGTTPRLVAAVYDQWEW